MMVLKPPAKTVREELLRGLHEGVAIRNWLTRIWPQSGPLTKQLPIATLSA